MNQKTIADFIGLLKYALDLASFHSENTQWNRIIHLAKAHHVEVMLYEAASKLPDGMKPASGVLQMLEQEAMTFIIQDANQISEVETLMSDFDRHGMSAIMLKGWIMKDLYPRTDLRSRADTDIFIRSEDELKVHEIIMSYGYMTNGLGEKKDTVYSKEPFITLEMHKNLFMYEDDWNKIFNDASGSMYIWNRIDKLDGYNHIYKMDVNMYYVYHIAHMVKHLVSGGGGIGVKAILDLWLFRKANEEQMDFAIIDADLQTLGLTQFADTVYKLACSWFSGKEINYLNDSIRKFGEYIIDCGAYGHSDNFVANNEAMRDAKKPTRIGYIRRRAFPSKSSMEKRFPIIKKYPVTLPYYWAKRLWYSGIHRRTAVKGEVNSAWNVDYQRVEEVHELYEKWGIPQVE